MDQIDVIVIGAGVIGLAVARELTMQGREVLVLEAEAEIGSQISSRNSEVIHAGIYYPRGSLKARLCVSGKELLYRYAVEHGVEFNRCGKLLVATSEEEIPKLRSIETQAIANGVSDLCWLEPAAVAELEPDVRCARALLSPSTGIIDSHGLVLSLLGDVESHGGALALNTFVQAWSQQREGVVIETAGPDATNIRAEWVVNAAGHGAPRLLRKLSGYPSERIPRQYFAKGNYFALRGRSPFRRLIYPVPEPGGLGIHATLDLSGRVRFGPDVEWVEHENDLQVNAARTPNFVDSIRRYWPGLPDHALQSDYAGIRPKIHSSDETMPDFWIEGPEQHGVAGVVNLLGIESPGLTACLAIAKEAARLAVT